MKLFKTITAAITLSISITACESLPKEDGFAKIYLTGGTNGLAEITPADVSINKEEGTMKYIFGISRSGLQTAEPFSVNYQIDNSLIPEGTVPLADGEYTLSAIDGDLDGTIKVEKGETKKALYLTIPKEVFIQNSGNKIALHLSIADPTSYELNSTLSKLDIVIDVTNFLGAYEDITEATLKNHKSPFEVTLDSPPLGSCDPYQHTPTEWIVNDAVKIHSYQGKLYGGVDARCWGNRNWLSANNFDFFNEREIINGKIYQNIELPIGKYNIEYEIGETAGGVNHAALIVAKGNTLPDFDKKEESIAWQEFTAATNMEFEITKNTEKVSIGFIYNIPKGVQGAYAIKSIRIKQQINVFN